MKYTVLLFSLVFCLFPFKDFEIQWFENLDGDFSFSQKQSLKCEAWCYEYAGATEIIAKRLNKDSIECYTLANAATHSVLHFYMINNVICNPRIELNSIVDGKRTYSCKDGSIKMDKKAMQKGILKAQFDMKFDHPENPERIMFWKGKIYTKIK
ncbi:hypothetical protein [Flavobacterium collinsii]|uniref:Uncharacterized protein n=1 Tax=Flavobacterium collinsii TaxID=1114861 RepID=A0ABM8KGG7_9FLAO|nr:hypothetical protein [Flavobacterium collinsii]CAA9195990.1 hypothetical protein FLACOL7796_00940 [Flavobacterium collinsii]